MNKSLRFLSRLVWYDKYARYDHNTKRRCTIPEAVDRLTGMHMAQGSRRVPFRYQSDYEDKLRRAMGFIKLNLLLPSMRSIQFAGAPIERDNKRIYNCTWTLLDHPDKFADALAWSLAGTGVGITITRAASIHFPRLYPPTHAAKPNSSALYTVPDSCEGWAQSIKELFRPWLNTPRKDDILGQATRFDYSEIRPKGSPISTGFLAPGPEPLRQAHVRIHRVLYTAMERVRKEGGKPWEEGFELTDVEKCDIFCIAIGAALSGGVRRAAGLILGDADSEGFLNFKSEGEWYNTHPWRKNVNISTIRIRENASWADWCTLFERMRNFGEPGNVWADSQYAGVNPCVEAGLDAFINREHFEAWKAGKERAAWQCCNLTSMVMVERLIEEKAADIIDLVGEHHFKGCQDFVKTVMIMLAESAAFLGTVQGSYTKFTFLDDITRRNIENAALIGVSMTGIAENPHLFDGPFLSHLAKIVNHTNTKWAKILGINPAHRTTLLKPEGTGSIVCETTSGILPSEDTAYFRTIRPNSDEIVDFIESRIPELVWHHTNPDTGEMTRKIAIPVAMPDGVETKKTLDAMTLLKRVQHFQNHYVKPGNLNPDSPAHHNVSNTIHIKEEREWDDCRDYIFEHRDDFCGTAFLGSFSAYAYNVPSPQIPMSELLDLGKAFDPMVAEVNWDVAHGSMSAWFSGDSAERDLAEFNYFSWLRAKFFLARTALERIDDIDALFMDFREDKNNTQLLAEPACAGGTCSI